MSSVIGVTADLHFGRGGVKGVSQFEGSFREMIAGMVARKLAAVIFAGDVFHSEGWFTPGTFEILSDGFLKLKAAGIEVVIIPGNHDFDRTGTKSAVVPFRKIGVTVYTEPIFALHGGWNLMLIPWVPKVGLKAADVNIAADAQDMVYQVHEKIIQPFYDNSREQFIAAALQYPSACIFHASLIGFSPCDTAANIVGTDFLLDPKMFDIEHIMHVVGGHFHRRQFKDKFGYVGSLERNDFGERDNPTGWLELDHNKRLFHKIEKTRRYYQFDFKVTYQPEFEPAIDYGDLDLEAELLGIGEGIKDSFVKLRPSLSRHAPLDRNELEKPFYEMGAEKVTIDPVYTDTEQLRAKDIRVKQPLLEQFSHWETANQEKSESGVLRALLEYEHREQYPEEIEPDYFDEAFKSLQGVSNE